jgi:predicted glycosyltransferase
MKIWIDLDNSPHVPLFIPIIEELRSRGFQVVVTARDAFQVRELADLHGLDYTLIGRHAGKRFVMKLLGLGLRAVQLLPSALREGPALVVSHGSRSQLVVSAVLGIPSVLLTDYEHAKTFALIRPTWVMVPEAIPAESIHTDPDRVLHYPGLKEDVYVPRFKPDHRLREQLGLAPDDLVVTLRPPATEAHYHNPESETLFRATVEFLANDPRVRMVVLPRNGVQADAIRQEWPNLMQSARLIIPTRVVDGLNLIWHSDLVISGGGTMNREAAALGVPVYSIFRGSLGAVDRHLVSEQRLVMIASEEEVRTRIALVHRDRNSQSGSHSAATLTAIVDNIVHATSRREDRLAARGVK